MENRVFTYGIKFFFKEVDFPLRVRARGREIYNYVCDLMISNLLTESMAWITLILELRSVRQPQLCPFPLVRWKLPAHKGWFRQAVSIEIASLSCAFDWNGLCKWAFKGFNLPDKCACLGNQRSPCLCWYQLSYTSRLTYTRPIIAGNVAISICRTHRK